ncbi:hypothetical protein [Bacillus massiliigorillae]|uniref:hypothetical protein n=1 Tax=Bacillus massiliigorillae TaxID=1243664 RepID=UPI00039F6A2A|nr:hypothetical protein [Bacillus massiliigorillae]
MKVKKPDCPCKYCVWLNKDKLCMFSRCVVCNGWTSTNDKGDVKNDKPKAD